MGVGICGSFAYIFDEKLYDIEVAFVSELMKDSVVLAVSEGEQINLGISLQLIL